MTDYQGNSKKAKEESQEPDKKIEKVVTGEVIVQKKSLGRKFKDLFINADFGGAVRHVAAEVMLPAARNMIVDASTKTIERVIYGESAAHRRRNGPGPTYSYNTPISRNYRPRDPRAVTPARSSRQSREDFILGHKEEADLVLERMHDILDNYEVVTVADMNELVGWRSNHVDNKWGWVDLRGSDVRQVRDGYLIDLPPAQPV